LSVIDLGAPIFTIERCVPNSEPPPSIKGRTTRGLQNETLAVDLDGQILPVQIFMFVKIMRQPFKTLG